MFLFWGCLDFFFIFSFRFWFVFSGRGGRGGRWGGVRKSDDTVF